MIKPTALILLVTLAITPTLAQVPIDPVLSEIIGPSGALKTAPETNVLQINLLTNEGAPVQLPGGDYIPAFEFFSVDPPDFVAFDLESLSQPDPAGAASVWTINFAVADVVPRITISVTIDDLAMDGQPTGNGEQVTGDNFVIDQTAFLEAPKLISCSMTRPDKFTLHFDSPTDRGGSNLQGASAGEICDAVFDGETRGKLGSSPVCYFTSDWDFLVDATNPGDATFSAGETVQINGNLIADTSSSLAVGATGLACNAPAAPVDAVVILSAPVAEEAPGLFRAPTNTSVEPLMIVASLQNTPYAPSSLSYTTTISASGTGPAPTASLLDLVASFTGPELMFPPGSFPPTSSPDSADRYRLRVTVQDPFLNNYVGQVEILVLPFSLTPPPVVSWVGLNAPNLWKTPLTCDSSLDESDAYEEAVLIGTIFHNTSTGSVLNFANDKCPLSSNQFVLDRTDALLLPPACYSPDVDYQFVCEVCVEGTDLCRSSTVTVTVESSSLEPVFLPLAPVHTVQPGETLNLDLRIGADTKRGAGFEEFSWSWTQLPERCDVETTDDGLFAITPFSNATGSTEMCVELSPGSASACATLKVVSPVPAGDVCSGKAEGTLVGTSASMKPADQTGSASVPRYNINVTLLYCASSEEEIPETPENLNEGNFTTSLILVGDSVDPSNDPLFIDPSGADSNNVLALPAGNFAFIRRGKIKARSFRYVRGLGSSPLLYEVTLEAVATVPLSEFERLSSAFDDPNEDSDAGVARLRYGRSARLFLSFQVAGKNPRSTWTVITVTPPNLLSEADAAQVGLSVEPTGPLVRGSNVSLSLTNFAPDEPLCVRYTLVGNSTAESTYVIGMGPWSNVSIDRFPLQFDNGQDAILRWELMRPSTDIVLASGRFVVGTSPSGGGDPVDPAPQFREIRRKFKKASHERRRKMLHRTASCIASGVCGNPTEADMVVFREAYGQVQQQAQQVNAGGSDGSNGFAAVAGTVTAMAYRSRQRNMGLDAGSVDFHRRVILNENGDLDFDADGDFDALALDTSNPVTTMTTSPMISREAPAGERFAAIYALRGQSLLAGPSVEGTSPKRYQERLGELMLHTLTTLPGDVPPGARMYASTELSSEDPEACWDACRSSSESCDCGPPGLPSDATRKGPLGRDFACSVDFVGVGGDSGNSVHREAAVTNGGGGTTSHPFFGWAEITRGRSVRSVRKHFDDDSSTFGWAEITRGRAIGGTDPNNPTGLGVTEAEFEAERESGGVVVGTILSRVPVPDVIAEEDIDKESRESASGHVCEGEDNDCDGVRVSGLATADSNGDFTSTSNFLFGAFYTNPALGVENANITIDDACTDITCVDDDGRPVGIVIATFCVSESSIPANTETERHRVGLVATGKSESGRENDLRPIQCTAVSTGDTPDGTVGKLGVPEFAYDEYALAVSECSGDGSQVIVCACTHLSEFTPVVLTEILQSQAEFLWTQYLVPTLIGIAVVAVLTITSIRARSTHKVEEKTVPSDSASAATV